MNAQKNVWIRVNDRLYQAQSIRLNGRSVFNLQALTVPGRLEFVAVPRAGSSMAVGVVPMAVAESARTSGAGTGFFRSLNGMKCDVDVIESSDRGHPTGQVTITGRVISVISGSGGTEHVTVHADGKYVVKQLVGRPK